MSFSNSHNPDGIVARLKPCSSRFRGWEGVEGSPGAGPARLSGVTSPVPPRAPPSVLRPHGFPSPAPAARAPLWAPPCRTAPRGLSCLLPAARSCPFSSFRSQFRGRLFRDTPFFSFLSHPELTLAHHVHHILISFSSQHLSECISPLLIPPSLPPPSLPPSLSSFFFFFLVYFLASFITV